MMTNAFDEMYFVVKLSYTDVQDLLINTSVTKDNLISSINEEELVVTLNGR